MGSLYERIRTLCQENHISIYQMCKDISLSQGAITDLKHGRKQNLSVRNIAKISEYFNVSAYWLSSGNGTKIFDSFEQPTTDLRQVACDNIEAESIIATRVMLIATARKALQAADTFTQTYSDVFSPIGWDKLSEEYRKTVNQVCERCGEKSTRLHVHHIRPTKYGYPTICDPKWLVALCPSCHSFVHSKANVHHELIVVPEGETL